MTGGGVTYPAGLRYTPDHLWLMERGERFRIGIAHDVLDVVEQVVYVGLADVGAVVAAGQPVGEIEAFKATFSVETPISGTVTARNPALFNEPELMNADPYGEGWLIDILPSRRAELAELLDAAAYQASLEA